MTRRDKHSLVRFGALAVALVLVAGLSYWLGTRHESTREMSVNAITKDVQYWYDPMVPDQHFDKPGKSPFMDMALVPKYADSVSTVNAKPLYWHDPMVPDKHFDKPGKSPFMDMPLVAKYPDNAGADVDTVRVDPAIVQNLGLRTEVVAVGSLSSGVRVPGTIAWDMRAAHEISARVDGVIEKLFVRAPFETVRAGQALAEFVAPDWDAAAQEYLALGQAESAEARALRQAARTRLRVLGMDESQIRNLRSAHPHVVLRAPIDGVVNMLEVREGQRVRASSPLMTINGLDTVWVEAAIPQARAAGIVPGSRVTARIGTFPGETFAGEVEALLASVDVATRTQSARIVLDNPGHRLAPGMFADLQFAASASPSLPLVPDQALIASGADTRVIIAMKTGGFRPVRVRTGEASGGRTQILSGLQGGERIVVSGQFLIDSEASLSGALDRLSDGGMQMQDDNSSQSPPPGQQP